MPQAAAMHAAAKRPAMSEKAEKHGKRLAVEVLPKVKILVSMYQVLEGITFVFGSDHRRRPHLPPRFKMYTCQVGSEQGAQTLMLTMLATSLALVPWARLTLSQDAIQDARAATWG